MSSLSYSVGSAVDDLPYITENEYQTRMPAIPSGKVGDLHPVIWPQTSLPVSYILDKQSYQRSEEKLCS